MNKKILIPSIFTLGIILPLSISVNVSTISKFKENDNLTNIQQVNKLVNKYAEKYNFNTYKEYLLNKDKAVKEFTIVAKDLFNQNKIKSYKVNDDSIVLTFESGLTSAFKLTIKDTYGDLTPVYSKLTFVGSQNIYSELKAYSPSYTGPIPLPEGYKEDAELIEGAEKYLTSSHNYISYDKDTNYNRDVIINKELLGQLGPNTVALMMGHGTYVDGFHSTIQTGREFSYEDYSRDPQYREDADNGLIIIVNGKESITTRYIEKYVGDLTNSFIFLGYCESCQDRGLVDTFLNKGASAVIASTKQVDIRYADVVEYHVMHKLGEINPNTDKIYTAKEALDDAKNKYGQVTPGSGGETLLFGKENYRLNENDICPIVKYNYEYTGKEITFVNEGVGYTLSGNYKATESGLYEFEIKLQEGYKWVDEEVEEDTMVYMVNIVPHHTTSKDLIMPQGIDNLIVGNKAIEIITPGVCSFGTFYYLFDGSEDDFSTNIPKVTKEGNYKVKWYLEGDKNHEDLGEPRNPLIIEVVVTADPNKPTNNVPIWVLVLLVALGLGAVIALTVVTGNRVKKLTKEREEKDIENK